MRNTAKATESTVIRRSLENTKKETKQLEEGSVEACEDNSWLTHDSHANWETTNKHDQCRSATIVRMKEMLDKHKNKHKKHADTLAG